MYRGRSHQEAGKYKDSHGGGNGIECNAKSGIAS